MDTETAVVDDKPKLTDAQRASIENKRQRALMIRREKVTKRAYDQISNSKSCSSVDTGAGFIVEEEDDTPAVEQKIQHSEGAVIEGDNHICIDCGKPYLESFLQATFDYSVCDRCRDSDGKHDLITRTDAKVRYLLKDADLDQREPPLKYISRKNTRHDRFGVMRLYLHLQIHARALEVWGSDEAINVEHEKRDNARECAKKKKYSKKMKALRMQVRSSLYTKEDTSHVHEYGDEQYNDAEDKYFKKCASCGHNVTYEKM